MVIGSGLGIAVLAIAGILAVFCSSLVSTSTVMSKRSPDRQHVAKLMRVQGIDVNFRVTVDGKRVYASPDFAPVAADFREHLIWSSNNQIVILEVGDRPIFGYHVGEMRALTGPELLNVQFTPFEKLGYEGTCQR